MIYRVYLVKHCYLYFCDMSAICLCYVYRYIVTATSRVDAAAAINICKTLAAIVATLFTTGTANVAVIFPSDAATIAILFTNALT